MKRSIKRRISKYLLAKVLGKTLEIFLQNVRDRKTRNIRRYYMTIFRQVIIYHLPFCANKQRKIGNKAGLCLHKILFCFLSDEQREFQTKSETCLFAEDSAYLCKIPLFAEN